LTSSNCPIAWRRPQAGFGVITDVTFWPPKPNAFEVALQIVAPRSACCPLRGEARFAEETTDRMTQGRSQATK
jgi:hypothetical protein